jgi:hypothetical protein
VLVDPDGDPAPAQDLGGQHQAYATAQRAALDPDRPPRIWHLSGTGRVWQTQFAGTGPTCPRQPATTIRPGAASRLHWAVARSTNVRTTAANGQGVI